MSSSFAVKIPNKPGSQSRVSEQMETLTARAVVDSWCNMLRYDLGWPEHSVPTFVMSSTSYLGVSMQVDSHIFRSSTIFVNRL